jgi:DUF1365 family protein
MISGLYECQVLHARFAPQPHRFVYRIFLFAFDLDELDRLPQHAALFSVNRRNLYSFRDADFFPTASALHNPAASPSSIRNPKSEIPNLKSRVTAYAAAHGVDVSGGRIVLVTLPRIFGYLFNPVSFYFCFDRSGRPAAAIAEVTNTFREVKPFFLGPACLELTEPKTQNSKPKTTLDSTPAANSEPQTQNSELRTRRDGAEPHAQPENAGARAGVFRLRVPKHFYVSPFSDVDVAFDFTLRVPGDRLSIQIDDYVGAERTLTSTLAGPRRELTTARLAWFTLKYPLLTVRIIALIHWHAFRLWWKKLPWFAKAARPADQRDLYRPHSSLPRSPSLALSPAALPSPSLGEGR